MEHGVTGAERPSNELELLQGENVRLLKQASAVASANAFAAELMVEIEEAREEISAKNRQMREILDNVGFGFLTVGADHAVGDQATASCQELFATTEVAGRRFEDLVASGGAAESLALCLDEVFEDVMPERSRWRRSHVESF